MGLRISAILKFKVVILIPSGQVHGYSQMMIMGSAGSLQLLYKYTRRHISQNHKK